MVVLGIVAGVVLLVLAVATTAMAIVGILGTVGAFRYGHCSRCGHFMHEHRHGEDELCSYCRHVMLFHPFRALHEGHLWHRGHPLGV